MIVVPQITITNDNAAFGGDDILVRAESLRAEGAVALQLRDASGEALSTPGGQGEWLTRLTSAVGLPVQLSGGLDDSSVIERVAGRGFASLVVGTIVVQDPMLLRWALDLAGLRIVVELVVDGGDLVVPGVGNTGLDVIDVVRQLQLQGVQHLLLRDITSTDVPIELLEQLCRAVNMSVTYGGEIASVDDIAMLAETASVHSNLVAVVVGEPLQHGQFTLAQAQAAAG